MSFIRQFQQLHFHAVVARSPGVHLCTAETVVVVHNLRCRGASIVLNPHIQCRLCSAEGTRLVARSMNVQDGNGAHVGIRRSTAHGITADGTEGCNQVGNLVHGVVRQHTSHREAAQVHAVAVNLVLRDHLVDNGLDEVDVAVATRVPCLVDAVREHHNELGRVANGLHAHVVVLELAVLYPVGILVVAVTEDEQRTVLAQVLGCIHVVRAAGSIHADVIGLCRHHSYNEQEEQQTNLSHIACNFHGSLPISSQRYD